MTGEVPRRDQQWNNFWQGQSAQPPPAPRATATVAEAEDPVESRALVALGYPFFPLALLALFDRKHSKRLRKHAYQAIGFNVGMVAFYALLTVLDRIPLLGFSADVMLWFFVPVFVTMSIFYGIRAWHGEDVRVPIVSDWLDDRTWTKTV
jgi:uncharacterized membrane protein